MNDPDYSTASCQASMVLDEVRTSAYAAAIRKIVRPGDVVMDVGSGSGIFALLAARAGAGKVYAVERTAAAELIREHVRENHFENVVEVIEADVAELDRSAIRQPPRVIISELLGNFAPGEGQHRLLRHAVSLAVPQPVLIPYRYRMVWAPVVLGRRDAALRSVHGVTLLALLNALRARPRFTYLSADRLLGNEVAGPWIPVTDPEPRSHEIQLTLAKEAPVDGIVVAFEAALTDDVILSTAASAPSTHWPQMVLPVEPILGKPGTILSCKLQTPDLYDVAGWRWSIEEQTPSQRRSRNGTGDVGEVDSRRIAPADSPIDTLREAGRASSELPASPPMLRGNALELEAVRVGVKRAALLSVRGDDLGTVTSHLNSLGLRWAVHEVKNSPHLFAQLSTEARAHLQGTRWCRVAVARSANEVQEVVRALDAHECYELGLRLGYPECCAAWAEERDRLIVDPASGVLRQSNLHALAIAGSAAADYRCNYMLAESAIADHGPTGLISHYPCRLDCLGTQLVADELLSLCMSSWPEWTRFLTSMLKSPVFHWSDNGWTSQWWDECCGICLPSGVRVNAGSWSSPRTGVVLGSGMTPGGVIPEGVSRIVLDKDKAILWRSGVSHALPRFTAGLPSVVGWFEGLIFRENEIGR